MRRMTRTEIWLTGAFALALQGCGTSSAAFSSDEDAYRPPPAAATPSSSSPIVFNQIGPAAKLVNGHVVYGSDMPASTDADDADTSSDFDNLEIVNPNLKDHLAVMRVGSDRTDSNLLSVFAGVKNKSAHPLKIEMQTIYKDKDGHSLTDNKAAWMPIDLKPHGETQYHSVAISEEATDFIVRIRHTPGSSEAAP
jgi:hypothetical protein